MKIKSTLSIFFAVLLTAVLIPFSTTAHAAEPQGSTNSDGPAQTAGVTPEFEITPQASGKSFTFTAKWGSSLKSRKWTTTKKANIYVKIGKISNCGKKNQLVLRKSSGAKVGSTRAVSCSAKTYVWKTASAGTYYFELVSQAPTGGRLQKSSGKVAYNGAGI